ncbi:unnamed protein product, partial [Iphiclides podalirius]
MPKSVTGALEGAGEPHRPVAREIDFVTAESNELMSRQKASESKTSFGVKPISRERASESTITSAPDDDKTRPGRARSTINPIPHYPPSPSKHGGHLPR